jgi:hypothetical protein
VIAKLMAITSSLEQNKTDLLMLGKFKTETVCLVDAVITNTYSSNVATEGLTGCKTGINLLTWN